MTEISSENKRKWLIFFITSLGTFMATLDGSIVNIALPVISVKLNAGLSLVQWVITIYLLVITSLLPIFGKSGDIIDRRKLYGAGFLIFAVGSGFCSLSHNVISLIISRAAQAIGASILMANSPAIIASTFPGQDRGRALGLTGTIVALGTMTGPSLGGVLLNQLGWQSIFYINIPIGLLGYYLTIKHIPSEKFEICNRFNFAGAFLFVISMLSFLLVLSEGHIWGWFSAKSLAFFALSVISFTVFFNQEKRSSCPMIDFSLFKNKTFFAGNIAGLFSFIAMFSNSLLLPFYLHEIKHLSPFDIGMLIVPFPITLAIVAPISGYLSERISQRLLTTTGLSIMMVGLFYFTKLQAESSLLVVVIGQVVMGLGSGLFQSPNNNSVISSVPKQKLGSASGLNALIRNLGMMVGTALAVSVFEGVSHYYASHVPSATSNRIFLTAYHAALMTGVVFAAIGAFVSSKR